MNRNEVNARTLIRGVLWNLLGQGLPVLAALILIPRLIQGLGVERFGILSLAWMVVGYFSFLDLGIGGAVTQIVSEGSIAEKESDLAPLVWTSLFLTFALGVVGGVALVIVSPWVVDRVLHVPLYLQAETREMLIVLAAGLPVVTTTPALMGTLAALQRFDVINAVRVPLGVLTFAGPSLALFWSNDLHVIALFLVLGRVLGIIALIGICLGLIKGFRKGLSFRRTFVAPLLRFGGWLTVSAVVGPLMVYLDRFLIAALVSIRMVAFYTTPYDLSTRLWTLSQPVAGVVFPAIAARFREDRDRARRLFIWGLRAAAVAVFPFVFLLVVFAKEVLGVWLGAEFAANSASVLRWIAAGVFINVLGQIALTVVQGAGRPARSARLHLCELPIYLVVLYFLVRSMGIQGAAIAWTLRVTVDTIALLIIASRTLGGPITGLRRFSWLSVAALAVMVMGVLIPGLTERVALGCGVASVFGLLAYLSVLKPAAKALGWETVLRA